MHSTFTTIGNDAIIKVGRARGFVVDIDDRAFVLTAAHCLHKDEDGCLLLPSFDSGPGPWIFRDLLGQRDSETTAPAKLVFVDPVADLAAFTMPDEREDAVQWCMLAQTVNALPIGEPPAFRGHGRILTLAGRWVDVTILRARGELTVTPGREIEGGMSGSPIVIDGRAVGVLTRSNNERGFGPVLADCLPPRLTRIHRITH